MDAQVHNRPAASAADKFRVLQDRGVADLEKGIRRDVVTELDALQRHVEAVANTNEKTTQAMANARLKVLDTRIEDLQKMDSENEKGLANAVFALNARLEGLGQEYVKIESASPEEVAVIKAAENAISEGRLNVMRAEQSFWFRGARTATAKAELVRLETALAETQKRVESMRRSRIMSAKMEQSLQEFMRLVDKTKRLIIERIVAVGKQLDIVSKRKVEALAAKKEASDAFAVLDQEFEAAKVSLQAEEEVLNTLHTGTPDHTAQVEKVSGVKKALADAETARNNALVVFQSKEKFANIHEVYEQSFIQMKGSLTMWRNVLESDTEERVIVFRARLEGMKAHTDQVAAGQLDTLGAKIDEESTEAMATYGAAAARRSMERIEAQPGRIRAIRDLAAAQLEAHAQVMHRMEAALTEFRRDYGVDPLATNFKNVYDNTAPREGEQQSAA